MASETEATAPHALGMRLGGELHGIGIESVVELDHCVELIRQRGTEVVALAPGFRAVDYHDRPFEATPAQSLGGCAVVP